MRLGPHALWSGTGSASSGRSGQTTSTLTDGRGAPLPDDGERGVRHFDVGRALPKLCPQPRRSTSGGEITRQGTDAAGHADVSPCHHVFRRLPRADEVNPQRRRGTVGRREPEAFVGRHGGHLPIRQDERAPVARSVDRR